MRILISNDDGIHADGINALRESLEKLEIIKEIFVAAPDRERSAVGHGITMHRPLRVKEIHYPSGKSVGWSVDGTPADCVKLAVEELIPCPPDLVVSGINQGSNLGTDVLYSGTVSAAVEGVVNGFPSVAISLTSFRDHDFTHAADFSARLVARVLKECLEPGTLINVNIPPGIPRGVRVTRLGYRRYIDIFDKRTDPRGRDYYWMAGEPLELDENAPDTDVSACREGYIAITPIKIDLTSYREIETLKKWDFI